MPARKSKSTKRKTKRRTKAEQRVINQMLAVLLFTIGLLFVFLAFVRGSEGWLAAHSVLLGLFGWSAYFIGPIFVYIAVVASLDKLSNDLSFKAVLTTALLCLISAACQIFLGGAPETGSLFRDVAQLYSQGQSLHGGGVISILFGLPLMLLGSPGDKIVVSLLVFALVMLITGSTLADLLRTAQKPVKKLSEGYQEIIASLPAREAKTSSIDIPLDDEPPAHSSKARGGKTSQSRQKLLNALDEVSTPDVPAPEPEDSLPLAPAAETDGQEEPQAALDDIISRLSSKPSPEPEAETAPSDGGAAAALLSAAAEVAADEPDEPGEGEAAPAQAAEAPPAAEPPAPPEYVMPPVTLLREPAVSAADPNANDELRQNAQRLVDTLQSFGVQTKIIDISRGPAVTRYELQPSAGVKISKITSLADDIALNLAAAGVRIEAPIPNKPAVGIEVPNRTVSSVTLREVIDSRPFADAKSKVTVALGKDISGSITVADIAKMPHLLIAGATGSGKSVCINSIIMSILYKAKPDEVKLLLVDPKVVELGVYNGLPHLVVPVVNDPKKAAGVLGWAVTEMLGRYKTFAQHGARDIGSYNRLAQTRDELETMHHIVIVIDELADLMMAAPSEVEDNICRLAQMARAAGMHLVIATQRPSVDVITGVIKANIPSRIAFAVSSQIDSRTILDAGGAEKLLGAGDMLFYPVGAPKPVRVQGCFVSDDEIERVVAFIKSAGTPEYDQQVIEEIERCTPTGKGKGGAGGDESDGGNPDEDAMLPAAIECVVEAGIASTSLLQRRLKLGYARAARIVDELEARGIVGPFEGSKPRQVLISKERWIEMKLMKDDPPQS